jgi:hypothetical protein
MWKRLAFWWRKDGAGQTALAGRSSTFLQDEVLNVVDFEEHLDLIVKKKDDAFFKIIGINCIVHGKHWSIKVNRFI